MPATRGAATLGRMRRLLFLALLGAAAAACSTPCDDLLESCKDCTDPTVHVTCGAIVEQDDPETCDQVAQFILSSCNGVSGSSGREE